MFLQRLIAIAPFPEDTKKELLASLDTFSVEKRFELTELCWTLITGEYEEHIRSEVDKKMLEMIQGGNEVTPEDVMHIEDRLFNELANKLGVLDDQQKINEVREELEKHKTTA